MTPGTIVQIYKPGFMGRVGPVIGREGDKLLVLIDGKAVKVPVEKAVPVGGQSREGHHLRVQRRAV